MREIYNPTVCMFVTINRPHSSIYVVFEGPDTCSKITIYSACIHTGIIRAIHSRSIFICCVSDCEGLNNQFHVRPLFFLIYDESGPKY